MSGPSHDLAARVASRDAFLAMLGDELRNPMCAVLLGLTNALGHVDEPPDGSSSLRARLSSLERHTRAFVRRAGVLLDVPRMIDGSLRPDRALVSLSEAASEAAAELAPKAARAGCTLAVDLEPGVAGWWDPAAIQHVAHAFIARAVQCGAGHPVSVSVDTDADVARIAVRSAGQSLPLEVRARVFDPFERAVSGGPCAGLVLDLWMCRLLVEAHAGTIEIESSPGFGCVFAATLPRRSQDATQ